MFLFCRLEPVLENRLGGAADLGAGAVGGEVPEPHQVHGALQQHVLLDPHPHSQSARWKGTVIFYSILYIRALLVALFYCL
jgi:hypothetical protein